MKLLRLKAENIFSLGHIDQELAGRGLTLVTGFSEDEGGFNGSGKSSLANKSILFCLFGETAGGLKADSVLNRHMGKRKGFAEIDFIGKDGAEYRVRRERPANLVLERGGQDVSAKTAKDTQDMINKALGIDFKTFVQTSFFGQGRNISYPSLTPKEQKIILEQILPMEQVDAWASYAEAQYKEVSKLAMKIEGELTVLSTQHQTIKSECDIAAYDAQMFHTRQKKDIEEVEQKLATVDAAFADERAKLEVLQAQVADIDLVEIGQRKMELQERFAQIRQSDQKEVDAALVAARESETQWKVRRVYLAKEMDTINNSAACPTCLRAYDNLSDIEERKVTTRTLIEEANLNTELAQRAVNHYQEESRKIAMEADLIQRDLLALAQKETARNNAAMQVGQVNTKIKFAKESLEAQRTSIQNRENTYDITRARLAQQLILLDAKILEVNKRLGIVNGEVEHLDYWREVYAQELKLKLFEDACPFLDSRTAYHLEKLKNNQIHVEFSTVKRLATGKAKEEFDVTVWSETGGKGFDSLSGGEAQIVSFAVGLALSDLASSVSSTNSSFLILDEVFSELDTRNSEAIVEYLTGELGKSKDTIFLISNDEALKSLIPSRIHVVKRSGITSVV